MTPCQLATNTLHMNLTSAELAASRRLPLQPKRWEGTAVEVHGRGLAALVPRTHK